MEITRLYLQQLFSDEGGKGGARYQLGKIKSKFIIMDLMSYAFTNFDAKSCLYRSSRSLRRLIIANHATIEKICLQKKVLNLNLKEVALLI